jgi:hypothetical protein
VDAAAPTGKPAAQEAAPETAPEDTRAFTFRSVLLGLLAVVVICGYSYFNDFKMHQTLFIGNHLPLTIYAAFFAALIFVNPVLRRWGRSWVLIGLLVAAGLALFGFLSLATGSAWPLLFFVVAGGLACGADYLRGRSPFRAFATGELAVILGMALVSGSLPTSGLMRNFPQILVMPQHYGKGIVDWQYADPLQYVEKEHPELFPVRDPDGKVYEGYVQGMRKGDLPPLRDALTKDWNSAEASGSWWSYAARDGIPTMWRRFVEWTGQGLTGAWKHLNAMPLWAWVQPAKAWFPLLIVSFIFVIALCRLVHRQWSENEQLSYPIAEFTNSLLRNDARRTFGDVFYTRIFWIGFGAMIVLHLINGWYAYDNRMIRIPLNWNFSAIFINYFPFMKNGLDPWMIYGGALHLSVVAFAYFLPEEISFSLGLSIPLFVVLSAISYEFGHPVSRDEFNYMLFGSYVAMAGVIVYTGRHYYWNIVRRAFFLRSKDEMDAGTVAACRWFLAATLGFIVLLMQMGLDWMLATAAVFIIGVIFLVLARVSAEAGVPLVQSNLFANKLLLAVFGPAALGPTAMYVLQLVSTTLTQDNRECLAPYAINAFRVGARNGVAPTPFSRAMLLALVIGLFAAGIGVLYVIYDQGALADGYMGSGVPLNFATEISRNIQKLKRTGMLEESLTVSGVERFSAAVRDTHPSFLAFFAIGVAAVLINSALRLRYVWWPIHSIMFLSWGLYMTSRFVWSFLLGWVIKVAVVRIGGGRTYQDLKPLFVGIIVGELSAGTFFIVYGALRYAWTGQNPVPYGIFPG